MMIKMLALASALSLAAVAAQAQQQQQQQPQQNKLLTPGGELSAGTPGVPVGTTGTTYGLPGGEPFLSTPGGSIPMGAATQQDDPQPAGVRTYNNSYPTDQ